MSKFKTISSSFGRRLRVSVYGGSHEPEVGVIIEGFPGGFVFDPEELRSFLKRRAPGGERAAAGLATPRSEADEPVFRRGVELFEGEDGRVLGRVAEDGRIEAAIVNTNQRSGDYSAYRDMPRPGHADYTAFLKYGRREPDGEIAYSVNMAGGGPFSGRMTAPLCIAGGLALQYLKALGVEIGGHIARLRACTDPMDPAKIDKEALKSLKSRDFPSFNREAGEEMKREIRTAASEGDSVGAVVEIAAVGFPGGVGGPMYDGLESFLSPIFFGIPAVKGVEFGGGFALASEKGSEANDAFVIAENELGEKCVKTESNANGGILGGISSGMPITAALAFKPTPSIAKPQMSVSLGSMSPAEINVIGRHDPCIAVRAVPAAEAAMALGLLDALICDAAEK